MQERTYMPAFSEERCVIWDAGPGGATHGERRLANCTIGVKDGCVQMSNVRCGEGRKGLHRSFAGTDTTDTLRK